MACHQSLLDKSSLVGTTAASETQIYKTMAMPMEPLGFDVYAIKDANCDMTPVNFNYTDNGYVAMSAGEIEHVNLPEYPVPASVKFMRPIMTL